MNLKRRDLLKLCGLAPLALAGAATASDPIPVVVEPNKIVRIRWVDWHSHHDRLWLADQLAGCRVVSCAPDFFAPEVDFLVIDPALPAVLRGEPLPVMEMMDPLAGALFGGD